MEKAKTFQDLELWQKAHRLALEVYKESKQFPKKEMFGLTSQIRRAVVSVPANIAEGFKRTGRNDKARFYNIAQSSLEEVRYYLILAKDLNYFNADELFLKADEIAKMLNAYLRKIKNT